MTEKLTMLDEVLTQLTARKGEWPNIARETSLNYDWLCRLAQRRIPDPSVRKIQKLHDYFFRAVAAA